MSKINEHMEIYTTRTIFIVEDDNGLSHLIQRNLRQEGFLIDYAENGTKALSYIEKNPDIILLIDYQLPDMSGKQIIETLIERQCEVPFIVMTGFGDEKLAVEMMKLGAKDYLVKDKEFLKMLPSVVKRVMEQLDVEKRLNDAKQALRENVQEYKALFEYMHDGVAIYQAIDNGTDFIFKNINQAAEKIENMDKEEIIGKRITEAFPGIKEFGLLEVFHRVWTTGIAERHPVGFYKDERLSGWRENFVYKLPSGEIVTIYSDETEQKLADDQLHEANLRLEEILTELEETQQQVVQQERLSALGQLASGIAHDFNNALMPIMGYTELMIMAPSILDNKEKVNEYLSLMSTAAKDAKDIVRRLREFYRPREEDEMFSAINLNDLIQVCIKLTQPKWRDQAQADGIDVKIETDLGDIPPVDGNKTELREVLTNLILNAVDALPVDGTVVLSTALSGEYVVLEVSDTGTGMPEDVRRRCFEPFFSTKGEKGTGLGLSMVHGTIRRHNGIIDIESEIGIGTKFTIHLPLASEQDKYIIQEEQVPVSALNVLVVDDDEMVRGIIIEYLSSDSHKYEVAVNGREGLRRFREGKYDLVITDRAMPDMGGTHLAALIKQLDPEMPVIMLTGFGDIMEAAGESPDGVDSVISKPITLTKFRNSLAQAYAKR